MFLVCKSIQSVKNVHVQFSFPGWEWLVMCSDHICLLVRISLVDHASQIFGAYHQNVVRINEIARLIVNHYIAFPLQQ